jgi:hypothetical protein
MEYRHIHDSTKFFAFFVYVCVFACQKWITERVLVTIFRRQGMEAWKAMSNDVRIEKVREHFIVCGYGQVGRTVVDQLKRLEIPLVLIETNEGFCRELLKEGVPGDFKAMPNATMYCRPQASTVPAVSASSSTTMPTISKSR